MDTPDLYRSCNSCQNEIALKEHDTGLVLNDEHFLCKNCCSAKQNHEIMEWAQENSQGKMILQPIHVWMIRNHE